MEDNRDETEPTPRWVKLFGAVALGIIVLLAIVLLIGGGHGPGRHSQSPAGSHAQA